MSSSEADVSFGELLRDHRRAAGLTQEELAERAGLSARSISELERGGAQVPRRDTVALIVRALGLAGADRAAFEASVERRRGPRMASSHDHVLEFDRQPSAAERAMHNLPRQLTSFVGRESELDELAHILSAGGGLHSALLTLVGAGGVGKTRLAVELSGTVVKSYADGVWLVELAGLSDPALVPGAVATVLGLVAPPGRTITEALVDYLKPRQVLLLVDNCEHLVQACAEVLAPLLRECRQLQVLATSREPLTVPGEVTWRVPPLELPDALPSTSIDQIGHSAAVRLLVDRARAVQSTLKLTDRSARAIARICVCLDGIPLALELAAARLRAMSVEQLADRLEHDLALLGGRQRTALPQHQTLRATIDWSHNLLDDQERALFRRLSVFAGGWTLETAEAICSGQGIEDVAVLDLLTQLVDKSMVLMEPRQDGARFRLLEPIRHFAVEQIEGYGEAPVWRARHAAGFLALAESGEVHLAGPDEISSLDRLELEHDNVRAALRWFIGQGDGGSALRMSTALWRFWERRGHQREGCGWLDQAFAIAGDAPSEARGNALNALAMMYWATAQAALARPPAEEALAVCREVGDARGVAWAQLSLGMIAYYEADAERALTWLETSVPAARGVDDVPLLSLALSCLGRVLLWANGPNDPRCASSLEESLALGQAVESRHATGQALTALGELAWRRGAAEQAVELWQQALELQRELRARRGIGTSLEHLALGAATRGQLERAAWLWGAAQRQRATIGQGLRHDEGEDQAHLVAIVREGMGDAAFETAWADGQASTAEQAIVRALEGAPTTRHGAVVSTR
jgi:predicted ATPase/transcriptional regulator with XRE-family HTH domain